jgi:hypothetical protein
MATNTISARLDLSGDSIEQSQLMTFYITDPTIQSGAIDITKSSHTLGNLDGVGNTSNTYLYVKNAGSATDNDLLINTERSASAVGFFAFVANPTNGDRITLISSDNTTVVYEAAAAENTATNKFISTGTDTAVATSLINCIESTSGHGGKITVTQDAGALTLRQTTAGMIGNKTISTTIAGAKQAHADFTGGSDNVGKTLSVLTPGQWTAIPVAALCDISITSGGSTTCEYGYWTMVV